MSNTEIDNLVANNLLSPNKEQILSAVETIAEQGNVNYVPLLVNAYETTIYVDVKKRIAGLLNDIKHPNVSQIIVDLIQQAKAAETVNMLLISCWTSGVDYSNHLQIFANIVLTHDYATAFDALTVIDNFKRNIDIESAMLSLEKVKSTITEAPETDKYPLYIQLINILERLISEA